jgi:hypothetical protein
MVQSAELMSEVPRTTDRITVLEGYDAMRREGMVPTIIHLQKLAACGVGFHSFTEAHLATDNELVRNILLALLASLAKVEAQKISERTKAGMLRARARGKRIGRPAIGEDLRQQLAARVAEIGAYKAAKDLGVDRKTAMKCSNAQYAMPKMSSVPLSTLRYNHDISSGSSDRSEPLNLPSVQHQYRGQFVHGLD